MKLNLYQKPNARERIIFFMALAAFGLLFFRSGILDPKTVLNSLKEDLGKLQDEKTELLNRKATAVTETLGVNKQAKSDINWVGTRQNLELSADTLVQAAQKTSAPTLKVGLATQTEKELYVFKPISVTLSGSLAELGQYIESSESLPIPLVVERLSLEPSTEFADIVTLRLEGGFYAQK